MRFAEERIHKPGAYIPELDGVRALAVWMVLLSHMVDGWAVPEGTFQPIPSFLMQILRHGWMGVDLFFVLSGFLITGILVDSREKENYFRNFYARRFLRIFPLYYAVLLTCWIFYRGNDGYFLISLAYLSNFSYYFRTSQPHGPGVFWSLAVEEHFYLIWPCVVKFLSRRGLAIAAFALVSGIPLLRLWAVAQHMDLVGEIYSYSWFRFDGLAMGALLALWVRSERYSVRASLRLCLGMLAFSAAFTLIGIPFGILKTGSVLRYTQMEVVFAAFLLGAVTLQGHWITTPLRSAFAKLSGDLSFCIYLVHLSIGDGYQYVVHSLGWNPDGAFTPLGAVLLRAIVVIGATFAVAMLSRRYLEEPILRLKRHFEYNSGGKGPGHPRESVPTAMPS